MTLASNQLGACLERIRIEKKKNIKGCLCEYCSHLILLLLLVFGYSLSKVEKYDAEIYSNVIVDLPGEQATTDDASAVAQSIGPALDILNGPLTVLDLDQYVGLGRLLNTALDGYKSLLQASSFSDSVQNMLKPGPLHFAPKGKEINSLIEYFNETYTTFRRFDVYIHDSESEAVNYILDQGAIAFAADDDGDNEQYPLALIVLRDVTPKKVNYLIRQNYATVPNTNVISLAPTIGLDSTYLNYYFSGFLTLKLGVDNWAFNYTGATNNKNNVHDGNPNSDKTCSAGAPSPVLIPYPTFAYNQNPFYTAVGFLLGLVMIMSTMYPMSKLAKSIVEEKELRMRELMKIMGLKDYIHRLSWFVSSFILFLWVAASSTFITTISFIKASNPLIIFIFYFLFCMTEINLSMLVSVFFSNSKLAAIAAPVILFATILPRYIFYTTASTEEVGNKILACFLAPSAFAFGADIISQYEYGGIGVQSYNLFQDDFSFGIVLVMLFADFFIYGFLAWYLDQILPQEFGTPKHPLFIFMPSYWCKCFFTKNNYDSINGDSLSNIHLNFDDMEEFESERIENGTSSGNDKIEKLSRDQRHLGKVRIKHLGKTYGDGKVAVKELSLTMLEGQITCLLGHNGAGKSTTIATLTGLVEATKGDVSIYGHLLSDDLQAIRQLTGLCPQHNVLFPILTVKEHLVFFGKLKGLYGETLITQVHQMIEEVGLVEKSDIRSSALSGGMKRKLCLAIALMGNPKFVLLDEPTSGMDPYSRRSTWELLQKHKANRVMMLTTHFMDEADTLADRIAIMSEGMLLCSGSSLFLKNRFGAGYLLSCSKTTTDVPIEPISNEVQRIISAASLVSAVAGEVIYGLPLLSAPSFPSLFTMLEEKKEQLGVKSFGISITTLEQVFISLARGHEEYAHDNVAGGVQGKNQGNALWRAGGKIFPCAKTSDTVQHAPVNAIQEAEQKADEAASPHAAAVAVADEDNIEMGKLVAIGPGPSATTTNDYKPVVMNEKDILLSNDTNGIAKVSVLKQLLELYRKRLIIASRDMKGFFFQIIFPAIQILLILLILSISVNPAGHTIILNGDVFNQYGRLDVQAYAVSEQDSSYTPNLQDGFKLNIAADSITNSTDLSEYLLIKKKFDDFRYGAFVNYDRIPIYIHIDWDWASVQLENTDNLGETIDRVLKVIYGKGYSLTFNGDGLVNDDGNSNRVFKLPGSDGLSLEVSQSAIDNFLDIYTPVNSSDSRTFSTDGISSSALSPSLNATTARSTTITVDKKGITITVDTSIDITDDYSPNFSFTNTVPWSEVDYAFLQPFLPTGIQDYDSVLSARYSTLHNSTSPHAIAAWQGELVEAAFQTCQADPDAEYLVKNHPLPLSVQQSLTIKIILSVLTSIFILVPLCYIPAAFVSFLVKERVTKCKHLQTASGVSPLLYWVGTYLWDMTLFTILAGFILIAFYIVGKSSSSVFVGSAESNLCVLCLVLVYGASAIPLNYLYSFLFSNYSTAQISLTLLNFMTGFVMVLAYYVMSSIPETKAVANVLVHIFRFFPAYNVGEGFINLATNYYTVSILGGDSGPFDWKVCGRNLVFMFVEAIGYGLAVLLSESSLVRALWMRYNVYSVKRYGPPPPPKNALDNDVIMEEIEVRKYLRAKQSQGTSQSMEQALEEVEGNELNIYREKSQHLALLIDQLIKIYIPLDLRGGQPKYAVRGMSLACQEGERFGLLGINGAGKTTTLSILSGESVASSGEIYIGNEPLSNTLTQRMLGYCPQFDPLLDLMNAYETLFFFGRIRGLPENVLEQRVYSLIKQTGLTPHAHRPCGTYSGGNKRKLSLAVALIGDPKVLLLDEPSTGMDPEARRQMWNVIEQVSAQRTVVLVSHSMEEIEALCTRVGVMVSGRMQCLGSVQHLKSKFGGAYTVELRCAQEKVGECVSLLQSEMPGLVVEEHHGGFVRLRADREAAASMQLGKIFSMLEENKERMQIYDYSVSQCSLEQVFIKFAKEQEEEPGEHARVVSTQPQGGGMAVPLATTEEIVDTNPADQIVKF